MCSGFGFGVLEVISHGINRDALCNIHTAMGYTDNSRFVFIARFYVIICARIYDGIFILLFIYLYLYLRGITRYRVRFSEIVRDCMILSEIIVRLCEIEWVRYDFIIINEFKSLSSIDESAIIYIIYISMRGMVHYFTTL